MAYNTALDQERPKKIQMCVKPYEFLSNEFSSKLHGNFHIEFYIANSRHAFNKVFYYNIINLFRG